MTSGSTVLSGHGGAQIPAARLALSASLVTALLLLVLHALKPELDPSWRFLSEYAIGHNGWVMMLAFQVWALSCVALFAALKCEVATRAGRIGNALLLVVAAALVVAGWFPQDPVTARPEELTAAGHIHALASLVGIPGIPVAAVLISVDLVRTRPAGARHRAQLMAAAHLTWISLLLMALYLGWAVPRAGGFTADVWAGWMNRLVVATYLAWQALVAYRMAGPATRA